MEPDKRTAKMIQGGPPETLAGGRRECVLHLGLPRTGTKTLQWHLFARHSEIHYLGMFIGRQFPESRLHRGVRDPSLRGIMDEIAWGAQEWPNIARCRLLFRAAIAAALDRGQIPVWSWEGMSMDDRERRAARAERFRKVFGPCKVAITLRHPVRLLESVYFMIVRRNNRELRYGHPWYEPIDDWIRNSFAGEIGPYLDYEATIDIYREVFGADAVRVFLFEDLRSDPERYVTDWCDFVGIDRREGVGLGSGKAENRSSVAMIRRARGLQRSTLFGKAFSRMGPKARLAFLRMPSLRGGEPVRISPAGRERIAEATRDQNRRLAERYGLPLERYGYPL